MRQFDLVQNPSETMRSAAPYVVVLSSHLLASLNEVIVAPVVRAGVLEPSDFDIAVEVGDETLLISMIGLAAISGARLKGRIGSLAAHEDEIRRALDRLYTGF